MIVYPLPSELPDADLAPYGTPESLGARVLQGSPRLSARIDFQDGPMTAGVFEATTGKVEIHFPFTEHATIIEGEVTITDEDGSSHVYRPGDSYFIRQGQVVIWEVTGERVRKSFFNLVEG